MGFAWMYLKNRRRKKLCLSRPATECYEDVNDVDLRPGTLSWSMLLLLISTISWPVLGTALIDEGLFRFQQCALRTA